MILGICSASLVLAPLFGAAAQTIYRCQKNGQLLLTDEPCDGTPKKPPAPADAPQGPPETTPGDWRGTVQLSLNQAGKAVPLAAPTTLLDLHIDPLGHFSGGFHDGACRLEGDLGTNYGAGDHAVDAQLTQCTVAALNLRYTGHLTVGAKGQPIHLILAGLGGYTQGKNFAGASVSANLNRSSSVKSGNTP